MSLGKRSRVESINLSNLSLILVGVNSLLELSLPVRTPVDSISWDLARWVRNYHSAFLVLWDYNHFRLRALGRLYGRG